MPDPCADSRPSSACAAAPATPGEWLVPSRSPVDRCADERAVPGLLEACLADPSTRVLAVSDGRVPVLSADHLDADHRNEHPGTEDQRAEVGLAWRAPEQEDVRVPAFFLGRIEGRAYVAVQVEAEAAGPRPGLTWVPVREVGPHLGALDLECTLMASALIAWHGRHGFCPRCGAPTEPTTAGWVRRCERDGSEHYPRTDPAMIVAVIDAEDRLLLARNIAWPERRRSVLAGFVDAGEHAAAAVVREVAEEVGVPVVDVRFVDDQPWPFPGSLMLGYTARATDTRLTLDASEIAEAEWWTREDLAVACASGEVLLPSRMSIARRLLELWFGGPLVSPAETGDGVRSW